MNEAIKKRINEYCSKHSLSVRGMERKAGTKTDSVYAFLTGKTSDMKLGTAIKIADMMNVSLDELANRTNNDSLNSFLKNRDKEKNIETAIYEQIIHFIFNFLHSNQILYVDISNLLYVIREISLYSFEMEKQQKFNQKFANWICERFFFGKE